MFKQKHRDLALYKSEAKITWVSFRLLKIYSGCTHIAVAWWLKWPGGVCITTFFIISTSFALPLFSSLNNFFSSHDTDFNAVLNFPVYYLILSHIISLRIQTGTGEIAVCLFPDIQTQLISLVYELSSTCQVSIIHGTLACPFKHFFYPYLQLSKIIDFLKCYFFSYSINFVPLNNWWPDCF